MPPGVGLKGTQRKTTFGGGTGGVDTNPNATTKELPEPLTERTEGASLKMSELTAFHPARLTCPQSA